MYAFMFIFTDILINAKVTERVKKKRRKRNNLQLQLQLAIRWLKFDAKVDSSNLNCNPHRIL